MLKLKLKQVGRRKNCQVAAWWQAEKPIAFQWQMQRNLNLTQQLHKSNAKQLREEVQLLMVFCVVGGSAPIAVFPRCSARLYEKVQHCWLLALYVWLCTAAYCEQSYSSEDLNTLERNFYIFESIAYMIHVPCIMILSMGWKHKIAGVFDTIGQYDMASGYIVKRYQIRRFVCYQLLLVLLFVSCCIPIVVLSSEFNAWKFMLNLSTYVLPNVLSSVSFVMYYTLLHGIYLRLHCLVASLEVELKRGPAIRRASLQQLRWQHTCLLHFTKMVNTTFGVSAMLVFVSSLINFNTNLFLTYKAIEKLDEAFGPWLVYTILWLLLHFGKMFCILYFNHNVQQEHTTCLALLTNVHTNSEALRETINHFMLQLQANIRAHVACGLFELDYKLIPALMMTTASLFIFLLQYDITYKALNRAVNGTII